MINSLSGKASGKSSDALFLVTGGLEWEIAMPASDLQEVVLNAECRVFTWLYHREDQMRLFGFADERRRSAFLELLTVEGIGPKAALKILGGIKQDDLERALEEGDVARLEAVPGLGKKTAQKMILQLKGKLVHAQKFSAASPYNDLVEALAAMGYDRRTAAEAIAKADAAVSADMPAADREKLLFKEAITYLSGA
ncbi:MAG: Holliday junction branch migration protein RuvA [Treponema sp.]|jgi:Holliday junction DNA helicase RuvA|nr:Holliday junction branch migration protein RuvA [Treponema sp.]